MKTIVVNGLEWMAENLTGYGGTEINGNWYYTWEQAMNAAKEIGDGWRLPTQEEFEALCNLDSTWDNERKGIWLGKNKELFLPDLGCLVGMRKFGKFGHYWSKSIKQGEYAKSLSFIDEIISPFHVSYKKNGFSVRLVRDIKIENNPQKVYALFEGYGSGKFEPLIGVFTTYEKAENAKAFLNEIKNCPHFITETKIDEIFSK